jgi:hypothetical protein
MLKYPEDPQNFQLAADTVKAFAGVLSRRLGAVAKSE